MNNASTELLTAKAIIRAEAYRLLAVLFGECDVDAIAEELSTAVHGPLGEYLEPFVGTLDEEIAYEHTRLFAQSVAASPCETSYSRGDKGTVLGQLSALYGLFGARAGGNEPEAPDHLCVELEFASILCLKEALAIESGDEEKLSIVRRAQEVFFAEHLGAFAPRFVQRLVQATSMPYYVAAGEFLARWLAHDLERQGITPERWATQLPMLADDDEPATCPVEVGAEI